MSGKGMRVLHILFDGPDELASRMVREHEAMEDIVLKVMDMSAGALSAAELVDEIFASDKVFSWHT